jgi:beta-lactamase class A
MNDDPELGSALAFLFPNNGKAVSSNTLRLPQNRRGAPAALSDRMLVHRSVLMMSRRTMLTGSLLAAPALVSLRAAADDTELVLLRDVDALERRHGGRLGVAILNGTNGIGRRDDERFALCSTFKFLAAAFVLARVDRGEESLNRRVLYSKSDLVTYSPTTEKHVESGLTIGEICEAAMVLSDNTAGNLLLDSFGGPAGLTSFMRSLGDTVTRLDRRETELNEATPGDPRDTTTPHAMLEVLRRIVLGSVLSPSSREQLTAWLVANRTGDKRLRAGVPKAWRIGDKTGSGSNNATNDIAVIWPAGRAPILVTAYYAEAHANDDERNAVLAEVGQLATTL